MSKKETYLKPRISVLNIKTENCMMAGSGGITGDGGGFEWDHTSSAKEGVSDFSTAHKSVWDD